MLSINGYEMPKHISYSSLSTFMDCGQKYYLTRLVQVQESPAWWSVGGSAVHSATENIDKRVLAGYETLSDFDAADFGPTRTLFRAEWDKHVESTKHFNPDVPMSEWKSGGRASKQYPDKENMNWWLDKGPEMVANWVKWRSGCGWSLADVGDSHGVEVGIELPFDNFDVKMFIDRVMVLPSGEVVVVDLKTGSRTPTSDLQLAVYAMGLEEAYGIRPQYGTYWMGRSGTTSELVNLDYLSSEKIKTMVSGFDFMRKTGIFMPNLSNCYYCSVADSCEWSKK